MGSWCPNCTDESRFLKELYAEHKTNGLQIIPVAFERGDDVAAACKRVAKQFNQLQLLYPFYYGGKASKDEAQKTLSFLTEVHSFPTSIFIDKKGIIRRVYTGYYGPGTHEEYEKHSKEIKSLVAELINE
jgi:peroxiredoxin